MADRIFILISNKMEFCDPDWIWRERFKGEWDIPFYHGKGEEEYEDGSEYWDAWWTFNGSGVRLVCYLIFDLPFWIFAYCFNTVKPFV